MTTFFGPVGFRFFRNFRVLKNNISVVSKIFKCSSINQLLSFELLEQPANQDDADGVGQKVPPVKAAADNQAAQISVAQRNQPAPSQQLRELDEEGDENADEGNGNEILLDPDHAAEAEQHHGPEGIAGLIGQPTDAV